MVVLEALAVHAGGERGHDVYGVFVAKVVAGREFLHVAVEVLRAHLVDQVAVDVSYIRGRLEGTVASIPVNNTPVAGK